MNKTLHIVSCTTVANVMKQAKLSGDFLAWEDFLHEGPIPQNFSLKQLSKIRAHFLCEHNYLSLNQALQTFEQRNTVLENHKIYEEVILWFEQDLYDQLQLLQILDWFAYHQDKNVKLSLILTDKYFAEYSFQEIKNAVLEKSSIKDRHLRVAKKAWLALSSNTPLPWFKLLNEETSPLPFLKNSVQRLLEAYPNTMNGLSRTEHQALLIISKGEKKQKQDIFLASQKQEEHPFIADIIFWKILNDFEKYKLITIKKNDDIYITDLGKDVLIGKRNWITIKPIEHWIGGVHLSADNLWCWNIQEKTIGKYYYSEVLSTLMPVKQKPSLSLKK
jgi:hypothetical protein